MAMHSVFCERHLQVCSGLQVTSRLYTAVGCSCNGILPWHDISCVPRRHITQQQLGRQGPSMRSTASRTMGHGAHIGDEPGVTALPEVPLSLLHELADEQHC